MRNLTTLSDVLTHAQELPWNEALFLPTHKDWSLQSPCAVCDPDASEGGDELPSIAVMNDLRYALSMSGVQDIVANAKEQKPGCTPEDLLKALLFYYQHDAFISFA